MKLTKREKQVLKLISEGKTALKISKELGISKRTVEAHTANMLNKTGASNKAHLVALSIASGDLDIDTPLSRVLFGSNIKDTYCLIVDMMRKHGFVPTTQGHIIRNSTGCAFDKESLLKYNSVEEFTNEWKYA